MIRIYELAKEIGTDSNRIIEFLGGDRKPASGIDDETAKQLKGYKKILKEELEK